MDDKKTIKDREDFIDAKEVLYTNVKDRYKEYIQYLLKIKTDIDVIATLTKIPSQVLYQKMITPFNSFKQQNDDRPTQKQIDYAARLGIQEPEKYSRSELSRKIDEYQKR